MCNASGGVPDIGNPSFSPNAFPLGGAGPQAPGGGGFLQKIGKFLQGFQKGGGSSGLSQSPSQSAPYPMQVMNDVQSQGPSPLMQSLLAKMFEGYQGQ